MIDLFGILLFLIFPAKPLPHIIAPPPPQGIFPQYGFELNDSELFAPIYRLVHSGAYEGDESDIEDHENKAVRSQYELALKNDSVYISEYRFDSTGKKDLTAKQIFLKNGKPLYSLRREANGAIYDIQLFKEIHMWLHYTDSMNLYERKMYDNYDRETEHENSTRNACT